MQNIKAPLLALAGALCFSTTGTFQAIAPEGANPFLIAEARMLIGCLGLFLFCWMFGRLPSSLKIVHWKYVLLVGLCLLSFQITFFFGVLKLGVAAGTVVAIGSTPICTAIVEIVFLHKKPARIWYFSTALAIIGIVLLNLDSVEEGTSFVYVFLPILAGLCYSLEIILSKKLMDNISAEAAMMFLTAFVAIVLMPSLFIFPIDWMFTKEGSFVCLGLGLVTAALAFALFFSGARLCSASVASTIGLGEPMGAACLGILLLNEPFNACIGTGIVLILVSIILLIFLNK